MTVYPPVADWHTSASRPVYQNNWLTVREDRVVAPDGTPGHYGVVSCRHCIAGTVPVDAYGHTWLVGQPRYPGARYSWEIPMGGGRSGEDAETTARRELREETGLEAEKLVPLLSLLRAPSISDACVHLFLAQGLRARAPAPDPGECIQVRRFRLADAANLVARGLVQDAVSAAALLRAAALDLKPALRILYEDEACVAVEKPSGILVHHHGGQAREPRYLLQWARDQVGTALYPVHRLDRGASGVLLFAKGKVNAGRFFALFRERCVQKWYAAVVRGYTDEHGVIDSPVKSENGNLQEARTEYWREGTVEFPVAVGRYSSARYSLVRIRIDTGRSHQIRRHFAHLRHPVLGDHQHGDRRHNDFFAHNLLCDRLMLAARELRFVHPVHGTPLTVTSPWPCEMEALLPLFGIPLPGRVLPVEDPVRHEMPDNK